MCGWLHSVVVPTTTYPIAEPAAEVLDQPRHAHHQPLLLLLLRRLLLLLLLLMLLVLVRLLTVTFSAAAVTAAAAATFSLVLVRFRLQALLLLVVVVGLRAAQRPEGEERVAQVVPVDHHPRARAHAHQLGQEQRRNRGRRLPAQGSAGQSAHQRSRHARVPKSPIKRKIKPKNSNVMRYAHGKRE